MLIAFGRTRKALGVSEEALVLLSPYFIDSPAAFAGWMQMVEGVYLRACERLSRKPAEALLAPLAPAFASLQSAGTQAQTSSLN
jgi:hypothetical protein